MEPKIDPVCGMDVADSCQSMLTREAVNYYFCSEDSRKAFETSPEKFMVTYSEPVEIRHGVYWVGAKDSSANLSINSYLVLDDRVGLIYDCTTRLRNETMSKVSRVTDIGKINYLIPTHYVFGQCCGFRRVEQIAEDSELVASEATAKLQTLGLLKDSPCIGRTINDAKEEVIDLGHRKLHVFPSCLAGSYGAVFVYDDKSRILFSGDFLSTPSPEWNVKGDPRGLARAIQTHQALKYPWIKMASKEKVAEELSKIRSFKLDIIAPSEGTIISEGIEECYDAFLEICNT